MVDSIEEMFRSSGLKRFVEQLAKRLRSQGRLQESTHLKAITAAERRSLLALTGKEYGKNADVKLADVRRVLQHSSDGRDLEEIIEAVATEPLRRLAREKQSRKVAWEQVYQDARNRTADYPVLFAWHGRLRGSGSLKSNQTADSARELLECAISIALQLPFPVSQPRRLAELAAQTCGDAHALDHDRPLGRLLMSAAAVIAEMDPPDDAASRREIWNSVGVIPDELSSTVLVWNLRADCDSLVGQLLNLHANHGEPARLTLAQLRRHRIDSFGSPADGVISVCENPAVMATAAARLGASGTPLICTDGQPGVAVMQLLTALTKEGLHLRYHGDFNWGGIHIGNRLWNVFPELIPWRFTSHDYVRQLGTRRLTDRAVAAVWDSELAVAMKRHGLAVEEELVLDDLLDDMRR